jgi:rhamnosyltransferase
MLVDKKTCKRLAIYFIYDGEGIVDDYILYMLDDLQKNIDDLFIVSNGKLREDAKEKLYAYTEQIFERENVGLDVWAYKEAMEQIGWKKLESYDEVILMNYTIMGPVYPLKEMFDAMATRDLDFWGITKFHQADFDPFGTATYGYLPEHIQSHFIAIRKEMMKSETFQKYWEEMPMIHNYLESVGWHESAFTKRFADQGFLWDVYVNTDDLEGFTYHPIIGAAVKLLKDKRCPIFKRRSFMQGYNVVMSEDCGQQAFELYQYLDKHTDYNMDLLWDNLLRVENMADLKKNLQLNYFLPSNQSDYPDEKIKEKKIAFFIHMYFPDLIDECFDYASNLPEHTDVYITTNTEEKKEAILKKFKDLPCNKLTVTVVENRGRDVGPFLVEARDVIMDYDYVCQMHDKKVQQLKPGSIGAAFSYRCFENMLRSKEYVKNIIKTFEENSRLGMLMPPPPNHGQYYITLGLEWAINYQVTKELVDELGIHVPMDEKKEPIAPLGTVFWLRPQALKTLFAKKWTYDDFPAEPAGTDGTVMHAIERAYGLCVQNDGYYPAWAMCDTAAAMEVTNLTYMIRELNEVIFYRGNGAGSHNQVVLDLGANLDELRVYRGICDLQGKPIHNIGKLYVRKKDFDYSEDFTRISINEECSTEFTYLFREMELFEDIAGLRFDPSDQKGICVEKMQVKIIASDGRIAEYNAIDANEEIEGNGIRVGDKLLFVGEDPQIYLPLKGIERIDQVEITVKMSYSIGTQEQQELERLIRRGEKVSKLKIFG